MLTAQMAVWLTMARPVAGLLAAAPEPTATPSDGFDWSRINPDPAGVPRVELFYTLINAGLWLGIAAILAGGTGALIAMALGPLFGSHAADNRGRAWLLRLSGLLLLAGSFVSIGAMLYRL
ncbi:hypothetical protein J2S43_001078 [Catenuloplanes nepalensis]|uniref:Uncharacterized protein n=1 Tax=Catenuloplanes nepalensis TaxID=587533 RepID=A0ABT9MMA5_9ACTN|nr:hypothetical protein [Catenuloplanes nepalensis]MDP9792566.1 hypothetical protein [Catenuloplanes nepalensis]